MRKYLLGLFSLFLVPFMISAASAGIKVSITAPSGTGIGAVDTNIQAAADSLRAKLENTDLAKFGNQKDLSTAMGNATVYSSQGVSFNGYQGYDLFAFMGGLSVGMQFPKSSINIKQIKEIPNDIKTDGDAFVGASLNAAINLGINISFIKNMIGIEEALPNRLYTNVKFFQFKQSFGKVNFDFMTFGLGFNYQLIDRGGDRFELFKWSGVSIGTGFMYNRNNVTFDVTMPESSVTIPSTTYTLNAVPSFTSGIKIDNFIIPAEVSTSLRLLWIFNLSAGAGVDFVFGGSNILLNAQSPLVIKDASGNVQSSTNKGSATVDGGTNGSPAILRPHINAGLGICLGPVPINLGVSYYLYSGVALNLNAGVVW